MAHTHHCKVCNIAVAICDGPCIQEEDHYCSQHHTDANFRIEDKPTVRMTVKIAD